MTSAESNVFFEKIYTFNDSYGLAFAAKEDPPEGATVAILLIHLLASDRPDDLLWYSDALNAGISE